MVFGEKRTRIRLALSFFVFPFVFAFFGTGLLAHNPLNAIVPKILVSLVFLISFVIALRVVFFRTPNADNRTYSLFVFMYFIMVASSFVTVQPLGR